MQDSPFKHYYKLLVKSKRGLVGTSFLEIPRQYRVYYKKGVKNRPIIGKLFVYASDEEATIFTLPTVVWRLLIPLSAFQRRLMKIRRMKELYELEAELWEVEPDGVYIPPEGVFQRAYWIEERLKSIWGKKRLKKATKDNIMKTQGLGNSYILVCDGLKLLEPKLEFRLKDETEITIL